MIEDSDLQAIRDVSRRYQVKRVLLFGSSLGAADKAQDIDLAVEGIAPETFFTYYGDLMMRLSKPVDVVDLSNPSKFNALIMRDGLPIYVEGIVP